VYDEPRMRQFVVRALGATNDLVETGQTGRALAHLMRPGNQLDAVIVTCAAPNGRPRYARSIGLIKTMFRQWPWIPIVVIVRVQDQARLIGEVLRSSVRTFLPITISAAGLRRALGRATSLTRRRPAGGASGSVKRILDFLAEHEGETFTLDELARMVSMSRSHFSHVFHTIIGMSLREYVRRLRLEGAHRLLVGSSISLTSIAAEAGFYDLPHFDKAFRQVLGMTPREFRRRHGRRRYRAAIG
jgi:AraC-like DNA-binding protein